LDIVQLCLSSPTNNTVLADPEANTLQDLQPIQPQVFVPEPEHTMDTSFALSTNITPNPVSPLHSSYSSPSIISSTSVDYSGEITSIEVCPLIISSPSNDDYLIIL
jgi:hypothetical protein